MSKILFWSPYHGQGQTSNLYVIALIFGILHRKRVLMMQTHFKNNNLESPLVGHNVDQDTKEGKIFEGIGLDMAITYNNMNKLSQKTLEHCCLTFSDSSILLMPGTNTKNKETFDRDIGNAVNRMVMDVDGYVDLVLIDSNSGEDELSMRLMTISDMVVVNLTQRRYVLEKFFSEYGERLIKDKKVFYIFGDYDDNSSYNINNCRKKYSKFITSNNSGVIPYCTKFMDAQNESNVMKFLQNGLLQRRNRDRKTWLTRAVDYFMYGKYAEEETEYFFHRSLLCVEKMLGMMQISVKKEPGEENVKEKHLHI